MSFDSRRRTHGIKKTTGELNEAMVSVSAMLNKHKQGKVYESIKPQLIPIIDIEELEK